MCLARRPRGISIGRIVHITRAYLCTGTMTGRIRSSGLLWGPLFCARDQGRGAGCGCPGVTIGEQAVATAGSVVTKDIPAFEITRATLQSSRRNRVLGSLSARQIDSNFGSSILLGEY